MDSRPKHPAKYSKELRPIIGELLKGHQCVVDHFGGVGGIHLIAEEYEVPMSVAIEIENEWASQWNNTDQRFTINGDSKNLVKLLKQYSVNPDVIAFSPDYGNRMADHHEAKDNSKRNTYRHCLGRMPSNGATTTTYFQKGGKDSQYEEMHRTIWEQVGLVMQGRLGSGTLSKRRVICNASDFLRTQSSKRKQPLSIYEEFVEDTAPGTKHRVRCKVTDWHCDVAQQQGFKLLDRIEVPTRRNKQGANSSIRVATEAIMVFGI